MGQVLQAGAGPDAGPAGRGRRRHPDDGPVAADQQGLPVRAGRDRAGRPADPGRRVRRRGGRRHGVDDQRAAPAAQLARRASSTATVELLDAMAHDGLYRRLRPGRDGRVDRAAQRRGSASPARSRTSSPPAVAPAGRRGAEERPVRRGDRRRSDPAAQGRPDRSSATTRASAPTPRSSRWPGCGRRSPRTARSPPAPPRRSPTAPARSS